MAEDYAAKMSRKTDAELRDYVTNRYQYREEAVLAALDELNRRGIPEEASAVLVAELQASKQQTDQREAVVREQEAAKDLARRVARGEAEPEAATGPALYSPGTITVFSVLFSMVAGGIMLALNLRALRRTGAALLVLAFVLVYAVGGSYLLVWTRQMYGEQYSWLGSFFNLPAIVLYNLFFWPRYIGPIAYQSRSWVRPLLICGLIMASIYYAAARLQVGVAGL